MQSRGGAWLPHRQSGLLRPPQHETSIAVTVAALDGSFVHTFDALPSAISLRDLRALVDAAVGGRPFRWVVGGVVDSGPDDVDAEASVSAVRAAAVSGGRVVIRFVSSDSLVPAVVFWDAVACPPPRAGGAVERVVDGLQSVIGGTVGRIHLFSGVAVESEAEYVAPSTTEHHVVPEGERAMLPLLAARLTAHMSGQSQSRSVVLASMDVAPTLRFLLALFPHAALWLVCPTESRLCSALGDASIPVLSWSSLCESHTAVPVCQSHDT
jgi:hypothetical protein